MGALSVELMSRCVVQEQQDETQLWREMASLQTSDALPDNMPHLMYTRLGSLMRFCDYPERLKPFLQHFPREKYALESTFLRL